MISFILSFLVLLNVESKTEIFQFDPCRIHGKVYIEENPRYAHYRVYEETSETFADVIVFEEENPLYADRQGIWSFTDNRDFADVWIYFEKERNMADFAVFYTDFESFAGCNR